MDISTLKNPALFRQQAFFAGDWHDADSKETLEINNPATADSLGSVPNMGAVETQRAIEAANKAWPAWKAKTAVERSAILEKWHDLIMQNQQDLAILMTLEQGKSLTESSGEVAYGASFIKWFAEEGKRVYGDTIPSKNPNHRPRKPP